jgi:hypothetical protein
MDVLEYQESNLDAFGRPTELPWLMRFRAHLEMISKTAGR